MNKKPIVLIGMAGVGKSTIGKQLAKQLQFKFVDLDISISEKHQKPLQDILDKVGANAFIQIEEDTFLELDLNKTVLAPGGSLIYSQKAMEHCKETSTIVYLEDTLQNIESKIHNPSTRGIVGLKSASLKDIFNERKPLYEKYAMITVSCQNKTWEQLTREILEQLQ